jgi:hypothetical protein
LISATAAVICAAARAPRGRESVGKTQRGVNVELAARRRSRPYATARKTNIYFRIPTGVVEKSLKIPSVVNDIPIDGAMIIRKQRANRSSHFVERQWIHRRNARAGAAVP